MSERILRHHLRRSERILRHRLRRSKRISLLISPKTPLNRLSSSYTNTCKSQKQSRKIVICKQVTKSVKCCSPVKKKQISAPYVLLHRVSKSSILNSLKVPLQKLRSSNRNSCKSQKKSRKEFCKQVPKFVKSCTFVKEQSSTPFVSQGLSKLRKRKISYPEMNVLFSNPKLSNKRSTIAKKQNFQVKKVHLKNSEASKRLVTSVSDQNSISTPLVFCSSKISKRNSCKSPKQRRKKSAQNHFSSIKKQNLRSSTLTLETNVAHKSRNKMSYHSNAEIINSSLNIELKNQDTAGLKQNLQVIKAQAKKIKTSRTSSKFFVSCQPQKTKICHAYTEIDGSTSNTDLRSKDTAGLKHNLRVRKAQAGNPKTSKSSFESAVSGLNINSMLQGSFSSQSSDGSNKSQKQNEEQMLPHNLLNKSNLAEKLSINSTPLISKSKVDVKLRKRKICQTIVKNYRSSLSIEDARIDPPNYNQQNQSARRAFIKNSKTSVSLVDPRSNQTNCSVQLQSSSSSIHDELNHVPLDDILSLTTVRAKKVQKKISSDRVCTEHSSYSSPFKCPAEKHANRKVDDLHKKNSLLNELKQHIKEPDINKKIPRKNTLKRKRWVLDEINARSTGHEDDLLENLTFTPLKNLLEHDNESEISWNIGTPKCGFQLSPALPKRTPVYKDCFSLTELKNSRKNAEQFMFRNKKKQSSMSISATNTSKNLKGPNEQHKELDITRLLSSMEKQKKIDRFLGDEFLSDEDNSGSEHSD